MQEIAKEIGREDSQDFKFVHEKLIFKWKEKRSHKKEYTWNWRTGCTPVRSRVKEDGNVTKNEETLQKGENANRKYFPLT